MDTPETSASDEQRYRLYESANVLEAHIILDRLNQDGVPAELTSSRSDLAGILSGRERVTIWVFGEADLQAGWQIMQHVQAEKLITRVDPAARAQHFCSNCGYDLRGHVNRAQGTCPECQHPFRVSPEEVTCGSCGESVPGHFEICWNCGRDLSSKPPE